MRDYLLIAKKYASEVISGEILACNYVVLACEKFIFELKNQDEEDFLYYFDKDKAKKACVFIENQYHTKGDWALKRQKLVLEPWQVFFVVNIFGWLNKKTQLRKYRQAFLFVPRKNGKSALAAAIGLYMLCADDEYGAEVYSGATTEKQAYEVFRPAKEMAQKNEALRNYFGVEVNASNINVVKNSSRFEPLIGKPGDGSSPSCAIADEVHELKNSELIDTMITGMGARKQPLMLYITTAGDNLSGPCYDLQLTCQKILDGVHKNDTIFSLMYGIDSGDDWTTLDSLRKANPNFGVSVDSDFLNTRLNEAKNNARKQSTYQTKHLNIWVGSREAYFNVQKWRDCGDSELKIEDFEGQRCYLGLDLASKVDIAALEILFPLGNDEYVRFGKYYLPEAAIEDGVNEHYQGWMREGWLTITDGDIIDFNVIKCDILELSSLFEIKEVAYDPYQATMLVTELMAEGVPVIEMRATVQNFSDPMKTLDGLIRAGKIQHNNDPVMTWMVSNVVAKEDAKENVYPRKERPENKIDGVIALLMALNRAMNGGDNGPDIAHVINNLLMVEL